jgi:aspartyl-tRNA(Asn)/glutamyl-tRNA(Gln) amidotransferase subunit C
MGISKETLNYVAHLSRIALGPEELKTLSKQLESILDFIDKLKKADLTNVDPMNSILPLNNLLRDDVPAESLKPEDALKNCPFRDEKFFIVPKVIE